LLFINLYGVVSGILHCPLNFIIPVFPFDWQAVQGADLKASRMPEFYEHPSPIPYEAAAQMERDLGEDLRRAGNTVTGGH
jgi:hypothetical protein